MLWDLANIFFQTAKIQRMVHKDGGFDSNLGLKMRVPVLVLSCLVPSIMSYFADWSLLAR